MKAMRFPPLFTSLPQGSERSWLCGDVLARLTPAGVGSSTKEARS
jgi:hypothetical protein